MARTLNGPLDPTLRQLLEQRRSQLLEYEPADLGDLIHIVVAYPGDTIETVEAAAGVMFATNAINGKRFGDPGFVALFEFVERHGRWLEAVIILSDDGFGVALFVPDCITVDADLRNLLLGAV
ncbi:hypothetical protein [Sphingomonas sp. RS2018]